MFLALKYSMKTKICSKCKKKLDISCFYRHKGKKDGLNYQCKFCHKQYYIDNAQQVTEQRKQYRKDNILKIKKQNKEYYKNNTQQIIKRNRQYAINNYQQITKQRKQYRINNAERQAQYNNSSAVYERHFKQLEQFEKIRKCSENSKLLEVRCTYCGRWYCPTNSQVRNRIGVFNGTQPGEQRFYCSKNCKIACPTYNQQKYPKGFKKATSREVVPLLRQLVLKRDDYGCLKCGKTSKEVQLHVHHEKSYTLNKIMANDPDNCITLCKECHKWIHSQKGCKYYELRCPTKK